MPLRRIDATLGTRLRNTPFCRSILTVFVAVLLMSIGCDDRPTRVAISGTVKIDGEPLDRGSVKFVPQDARPSSGKIDENGHFTLTCYDGQDGAVLGTHRVQIRALEFISETKTKWFVPPKYADFRTSELEIEVSEPTDSLVIELEWGKKKGPYILR